MLQIRIVKSFAPAYTPVYADITDIYIYFTNKFFDLYSYYVSNAKYGQ